MSETLAPSSTIDLATIQVYRESLYCVDSNPAMDNNPAITLCVDQHSEALAALHQAENVTSSSFITAWNPYSQKCDDVLNIQRQKNLVNDLKGQALNFLPAVGRHPSTGYTEPSILVLGISLKAAKELGVQYEQNAIIWADVDAVPQLILLR